MRKVTFALTLIFPCQLPSCVVLTDAAALATSASPQTQALPLVGNSAPLIGASVRLRIVNGLRHKRLKPALDVARSGVRNGYQRHDEHTCWMSGLEPALDAAQSGVRNGYQWHDEHTCWISGWSEQCYPIGHRNSYIRGHAGRHSRRRAASQERESGQFGFTRWYARASSVVLPLYGSGPTASLYDIGDNIHITLQASLRQGEWTGNGDLGCLWGWLVDGEACDGTRIVDQDAGATGCCRGYLDTRSKPGTDQRWCGRAATTGTGMEMR